MFNAAVQEARQYEGSSSNADVVVEEPNEIQQYSQMQQMILDGVGYGGGNESYHESLNVADEREGVVEEKMNLEACKMHDLLKTVSRPLYEGCQVSQLAAATELLNIKA